MSIFNAIKCDIEHYDIDIADDFESFINLKLLALLEFTCDITASSLHPMDNFLFKYNPHASSSKRWIYNFNYLGTINYVDISLDNKTNYYSDQSELKQKRYHSTVPFENQRFLITFKFDISNIPSTILMNTNYVSISVDASFNFMSAHFERRFDFSASVKEKDLTTLFLNKSSIFLVKTMNDHKKTIANIEFFCNSSFSNKTIIFGVNDIPELYSSDYLNFENSFLNIMRCCEDFPDLFSDIFNDYPSYNDLAINGLDGFKGFLYKFRIDYASDKTTLTSNLDLFDMHII